MDGGYFLILFGLVWLNLVLFDDYVGNDFGESGLNLEGNRK